MNICKKVYSDLSVMHHVTIFHKHIYQCWNATIVLNTLKFCCFPMMIPSHFFLLHLFQSKMRHFAKESRKFQDCRFEQCKGVNWSADFALTSALFSIRNSAISTWLDSNGPIFWFQSIDGKDDIAKLIWRYPVNSHKWKILSIS